MYCKLCNILRIRDALLVSEGVSCGRSILKTVKSQEGALSLVLLRENLRETYYIIYICHEVNELCMINIFAQYI